MNCTPGKTCSSCTKTKSLDSFGKNKLQEDGLHYYCKVCTKNIRNAHKESKPKYFEEYRENHKERICEYHKKYRRKHSVVNDPNELSTVDDAKEKKRQQQRVKSKDPEYVIARRAYFKTKYHSDIQFKLKKQYESKLHRLFRENDATEKSKELIGCTMPEFRIYLESKFLPPMTISNYGTIWEFRRIVPFSDFDLSIEEDAKKCNLYSNILPSFIQPKIIDIEDTNNE
jgi:hypothetical protein